MKSFKEYLAEAERKRKPDDEEGQSKPTKDKEHDWSFDIPGPDDSKPLSTIDPEQHRDHEPEQDRDVRKKSSQSDTLRATQGISSNPRMHDLLSRMRDIEADPDDAGYPDQEPETLPSTEVNTENLPAVAGQALQAAGVQDPKFHQVANLPGNMSRAIRTLGKALFKSFTSTPTEDIWMIGNLNGQGPNSSQEVNAVAKWIREEGEHKSVGDIDFDTTIPGYQADIHQYSAGGIRWLLVMDEFGKYIYSWPEQDSVDAGNTPELGHDRPRLTDR